MAEMTRMQKFLLIFGFLSTGSINTMTKKWQYQSCGPTNYPVKAGEAGDCHRAGWKNFHKPWTQNIQMFFGEALVCGIFLSRQSGRRQQAREVGEELQTAPFYIFLLPACCDILGTGIGGVGMLFISASVWQMMRGSLMVFAAVWSVVFLGKKLPCYNWFAVFVSVVGLLLIGCSAIVDAEPNDGGSSNVPLGILLTCVSQAFSAAQMVVEEIFVKGRNAPPEQVVGSEGIWGMLLMVVILFVMYWIPGNDAGSYENVVDSMHMLFGSSQLLIFVAFYLVSIACFNFFGVTIAGQLSAVHRTINDTMRTMIIWVVEILVYYFISEDFGTPWKAHSYWQLIGFALLVLGNLIKNAIVKVPGLSYEDPDAAAKASTSVSTSPGGVSLMEAAEGTEADPRTGRRIRVV